MKIIWKMLGTIILGLMVCGLHAAAQSHSAPDPEAVTTQNIKGNGESLINIGAVEPDGATDMVEVLLTDDTDILYILSIDTASAFPGDLARVTVDLDNQLPISSFNLVINYDVSVLAISSVSWFNTRVEQFEYLSYRLSYRGILGDIQIVGYADINDGSITDNLDIGSGPIVELSFFVSSDLTYAGYSVPLMFVFRDELLRNDNTLTDPDSVRIDQEQIEYHNGYINIKTSDYSSLGDINENGVSNDIADIVLFSNFFISPDIWPLSPRQILISDVNRDGLGATIADLVYMIIILVNNIPPKQAPSISESDEHVTFAAEASNIINYESDVELGGLLMVMETGGGLSPKVFLDNSLIRDGLTATYSTDNGTLRMLICSETGGIIPAGSGQLVKIDNIDNFIIKNIQVSSSRGELLEASFKGSGKNILPGGFVLYQNYPNPFNPTTELAFNLPVGLDVRLTVYNMLGQEVKNLIDNYLTAGSHTIVWNGRNNEGISVASGIYLYKLTAGSFSAEKKMVLLK